MPSGGAYIVIEIGVSEKVMELRLETKTTLEPARRNGNNVRSIAVVVLCIIVAVSCNSVWAVCLEIEGVRAVESVFDLCCAQEASSSPALPLRIANSSSDGCRDVALTITGKTNRSTSVEVIDVLVAQAAGDNLERKIFCRSGAAAPVGHAGSTLVHLSTVRLLT